MFIDSHCHLDRLQYDADTPDLTTVLANASANQVAHMLCVSISLQQFPSMRELVAPLPNVSISCGVHPLHVLDAPVDEKVLRSYCELRDVVAIGETGLDYFYAPDSKTAQQQLFELQVATAVELNKPLIVHTRDAREDTLAILRNGQAQRCGGVLHCFTESLEMAEAALELGFYISISGIITFRNADELREVVKAVPIERLLIETDSPYLAPQPHRGKANQPAYVRNVAKTVAKLKGVDLETLGRITSDNFDRCFPLARGFDE